MLQCAFRNRSSWTGEKPEYFMDYAKRDYGVCCLLYVYLTIIGYLLGVRRWCSIRFSGYASVSTTACVLGAIRSNGFTMDAAIPLVEWRIRGWYNIDRTNCHAYYIILLHVQFIELLPDQIDLVNPLLILILLPVFDFIVYPLCAKCNFMIKLVFVIERVILILRMFLCIDWHSVWWQACCLLVWLSVLLPFWLWKLTLFF